MLETQNDSMVLFHESWKLSVSSNITILRIRTSKFLFFPRAIVFGWHIMLFLTNLTGISFVQTRYKTRPYQRYPQGLRQNCYRIRICCRSCCVFASRSPRELMRGNQDNKIFFWILKIWLRPRLIKQKNLG